MQLPGTIAGRYRPVRLLGRGGMGAVYEVEHTGTGERLALKVMTAHAGASPKAVERFKREARTPALIKSEHVVRVTDADVAPELDGAPFLVMELLEGADLEQATHDAPQTPATVVAWLAQIAPALHRAHEVGVIHRDLKPENLFLTRRSDGSPLVKVLDFGIAKVLDGSGSGTDTGAVMGTPRYMAPEQANPDLGPVTAATDVWALGLIAFRLLSARDYWSGDSVGQLIGQILHGRFRAPSTLGLDLGPAFDEWFRRSCARRAEERFPTVLEQVQTLGTALGQEVSLPLPSGPIAAAAPARTDIGLTSTVAAPRAALERSDSAGTPRGAPRQSSSAGAHTPGDSGRRLGPPVGRSPWPTVATFAAVGAAGAAWWLAVQRDPTPAVAPGEASATVTAVTAPAVAAPVGSLTAVAGSAATGSAAAGAGSAAPSMAGEAAGAGSAAAGSAPAGNTAAAGTAAGAAPTVSAGAATGGAAARSRPRTPAPARTRDPLADPL